MEMGRNMVPIATSGWLISPYTTDRSQAVVFDLQFIWERWAYVVLKNVLFSYLPSTQSFLPALHSPISPKLITVIISHTLPWSHKNKSKHYFNVFIRLRCSLEGQFLLSLFSRPISFSTYQPAIPLGLFTRPAGCQGDVLSATEILIWVLSVVAALSRPQRAGLFCMKLHSRGLSAALPNQWGSSPRRDPPASSPKKGLVSQCVF